MATQKILIKNRLESGECITPLEALISHGCFRLSDVIYCLKREPYNLDIDKEMLVNLDSGKKYASYFLVK